MPEELAGSQEETVKPPIEFPELPEETHEEETPEGDKGAGSLISPEGVLMLFIAGTLDSLSGICAFLIFFFGIGIALSKIVYVFGLFLIGGWAFNRSGVLAVKKIKGGRSKLAEEFKEELGKFFKKHAKKLGKKLIPLLGDIVPYWTKTVYEELTGKELWGMKFFSSVSKVAEKITGTA